MKQYAASFPDRQTDRQTGNYTTGDDFYLSSVQLGGGAVTGNESDVHPINELHLPKQDAD